MKDEHGNVARHTLIMREGETVKQYQRLIRTAHQSMEKFYRRRNAVDKNAIKVAACDELHELAQPSNAEASE